MNGKIKQEDITLSFIQTGKYVIIDRFKFVLEESSEYITVFQLNDEKEERIDEFEHPENWFGFRAKSIEEDELICEALKWIIRNVKVGEEQRT